jgi:hypothetical protein
MAEDETAGRRRRIGISLGTLVALVTLATGILTLRDQLFPRDEDPPLKGSSEIQRFDGVAGHFEESRAILGFLDQHDGEPVQIDVSFPDLAGTGNYIGDPGSVTYVQVFTECTPDLPSGQEPSFADGCMATSLELDGPQNDDSGGFLQHGVPVLKGYFSVDVTGALQMGVTPIFLEPLTFEEATRS